ncbi:MAG TPA: hypothetical protein VGX71_05430 [Pseudaminobacter sp.]|nr:hypothetical protein [Pseudaminobacter sp.]
MRIVLSIWLAAALALAATPVFAQSDLVAIDILIEPDDAMIAAAQDWNARLREQMPEGFKLDATHTPHITVLQTYVAADELDKVLAAVGAAVPSFNIGGLQLEATGLYHVPAGKIGLQGIVVAPSPELLAVQEAVVAAVVPFRRSGGGQDAFVPDPTGTKFDPALFEYVENFIPKHSGPNYNPHVTTGVGPIAWVVARETEPFEHFRFGAKGIAVYHLGNFGTAAKRLAGF